LIAMTGVILRFGSYFSQMGVGAAMVQKEQISSQDIITAFTSSFELCGEPSAKPLPQDKCTT
jgi:lipopolysaccharide exporter